MAAIVYATGGVVVRRVGLAGGKRVHGVHRVQQIPAHFRGGIEGASCGCGRSTEQP